MNLSNLFVSSSSSKNVGILEKSTAIPFVPLTAMALFRRKNSILYISCKSAVANTKLNGIFCLVVINNPLTDNVHSLGLSIDLTTFKSTSLTI